MAHAVVAATTTVSDVPWTVERALEIQPAFRWEILDGVLYMAAAPYYPHSEVVDNIDDILGPWVRQRRLGRVLHAQTGIYLNERNYLDPDLVYLRRDQLPSGEKARHTAAALAVEVMSPTSLRAPREAREARFQRMEVEELWYVSLRDRTLEVRRLTPEGYVTAAVFRVGDTVTTGVLPGLEFPLDALWEDIGD
jgi:Uma2 family endonuclease